MRCSIAASFSSDSRRTIIQPQRLPDNIRNSGIIKQFFGDNTASGGIGWQE
jgi:hypothetical protein